MQIPLSSVNILKTSFEEFISSPKWFEKLLKGDFYEFEKILHQKIQGLYDDICKIVLPVVSQSPAFIATQKATAKALGLKKLRLRKASVHLRTGTKITYPSLYAKKRPSDYTGHRHLAAKCWQMDSSYSPMYKSINGLFSVICPSFEVTKNLLKYQGIQTNYEKTRQMALELGRTCLANRSSIQLAPQETLAGKRVVIALDGGRTRTRCYSKAAAANSKDLYNQKESHQRTAKFKALWCEPKLFVITTCDSQGKLNKATLPIYDATFGDDACFALLADYLKKLEIDQASSVQFLADGALWIWRRVRPLLLNLGVAASKITETLDYYHAMEHLHDMKQYLDTSTQAVHFTALKQALWEGDIDQMTRIIKQGISGVDVATFKPLNYFRKNKTRIDYQSLRAENRPCGSGIVESGIRRIINLRFKSPASFWYPRNAEKLIFLRGLALSGRWEIMMKNLYS